MKITIEGPGRQGHGSFHFPEGEVSGDSFKGNRVSLWLTGCSKATGLEHN